MWSERGRKIDWTRKSIELSALLLWDGQGYFLGDWATGMKAKVKLNKNPKYKAELGRSRFLCFRDF